MEKNEKFYIGIDLGGKEKKTTGICILVNNKIVLLKDVFGKDVMKVINPYLKNTQVIAIDAPLTKGRGKGKMRLYEKFLSTKIFRQERVNPIPPALMPNLVDFAIELVKKLEKRGFVLDLNLIEVFPTLAEKICKREYFLKGDYQVDELRSSPPFAAARVTENQKSALICAQIALLHSQFRTRWLGYKDGFLFLPEISFWKENWKEKFYNSWKSKPKFKYKHLITNIFTPLER
jgi:predicted nuclease with RNAse H fold